jgi:N-acetylneuraminate lyase
MPAPFSGLWPAMLTPLGEDGAPNVAALEQLVELFVRHGLDGIYLTGSTGQWPLLKLEERRLIAETTVRAAAGRIPVMVHVGASATEDAIALARHAAEIGADAVSAVGPTYYQHSQDTVFAHYRAVGGATDLPFFVYHLMGVSQGVADPAGYVARLLELPNIAGLKYTERDLYTLGVLNHHAQGRLAFFSGADEVVCQALLSGAHGAIGTFYNLWGAEVRRVRNATVAGDVAGGTQFMLAFQSVIAKVLGSGAMWSFLRAAMLRKHGIDVGKPRPPLGLTEREWSADEIDAACALIKSAAPS